MGGGEIFCLQLARYFLSQGHRVKLFTSDARLFRLFEKNHLPRKRLFVGFEPTSKWSILLWPLTYFIARIQFTKLFRQIPTGGVLILQSLIEKLVLTPLAPNPSPLGRGMEIWIEHKIPGKWLKSNPLKYKYLRLVKQITMITVSNFAKKEFVKFGVPTNSIKVVYPKVEIKNFPFPSLIKERRREGFTIGILSRLDPEKGVLDFVKLIIPELLKQPSWKVLIAGEGIETKNLESVAHSLEGRIELLGFVKDLDEFFSKVSVLVYPSKVSESFGISTLEAMARGIPVIASRIGALPEIIDNGSGFLVDNPSQWTRYLIELNNTETYKNMSKNALAQAQNISKNGFLVDSLSEFV